MTDFSIRIIRYKKNADFCFNDPKKGPFGNRLKNNFRDTLVLERYNPEKKRIDTLFACPLQSWANHPDAPADGSWSLATGTFEVVFFVKQGTFFSPVHGIRHGYDKTGAYIGDDFKSEPGGLRYLIHDDLDPHGKPYNGGFSQGCQIPPHEYHKAFNAMLKRLGVKPGDKATMGVIEI